MSDNEHESSFFQSQYAYFDDYGEQKSVWEPICDALKIDRVFDSVDEFLNATEDSPFLLKFRIISPDPDNKCDNVVCTLTEPYSAWTYTNPPANIDNVHCVSVDEFNRLREKLRYALGIFAGYAIGSLVLLGILTSKVLIN